MYAFLLITIAIMSAAIVLGWKLKTYKNELFNLMYVLVCLSYGALVITLVLASMLR